MACLVIIITAVFLLVFLFLLYIKWSHKYWLRRNVPYIKPTSLFGNVENPFRPKYGFSLGIKDNYDKLKRRGLMHGGIYSFSTPLYIPVDTKLIKNIFTRDFQHFISHGFVFDERKDPLAAHLFNLDGAKWRDMRVKLTPTFTSGKMKMMFKTLVNCGGPMLESIDKLCENDECLDIKEILTCYTTDTIGSCAFGLECNSFKDPNAEFRSYGRKIFVPTFKQQLRQFITFYFPAFNDVISFKFMSIEVENFLINTVKSVMDYRKAQRIKRNDFIELFLEMEKKAEVAGEECLTLKQITAQAFVFFMAGFETASTTMAFCLHELAFNQDIQDKLRDEVKDALKKNDGILTYDAVMGMKYMDQVVNETLRKYPPFSVINRVCSREYKVPGTDIVLEKGTKVAISVLGLHRDEEYYPDPEKFDPERFNEENKDKRCDFTFLPFGEGPRACIGLRFALMQTKTGLSMLLSNYKVFPGKSERYNMNFNPYSFVLTKHGEIMLTAEKLST